MTDLNHHFHDHKSDETETVRLPLQSILLGFSGKCPCCGKGRLFQSFMKTVCHCSFCNEEISLHRADDLPAYLVIVIVGHIVLAFFMYFESALQFWSLWQSLLLWAFGIPLLSLVILQPIKGGVVGLQWAMRMHGFKTKQKSLSQDLNPE